MKHGLAAAWMVLGVFGCASSTMASPAPAGALAASAQAALAAAGEPGERLAVTGTVFEADGVTRARGVKLHLYQTDARGYYSQGQDRDRARIAGNLTTGPDGRYRFTTIRPGHYAGATPPPAHIHFELEAADGRRSSTEMQFADDNVLPRAQRDAATALARTGNHFDMVQPVVKDKIGVWQATFDLKLSGPRR